MKKSLRVSVAPAPQILANCHWYRCYYLTTAFEVRDSPAGAEFCSDWSYTDRRADRPSSSPRPSVSTFAKVSIATRTVMDSTSESRFPLIVISASSCMVAEIPVQLCSRCLQAFRIAML